MNSLIIPVYRNEANLDRLLGELVRLAGRLPGEFEVVFVVDGSPDRCLQILRERLPLLPLRTQLLSLSRNFGSFAARAAAWKCSRKLPGCDGGGSSGAAGTDIQFFEVLLAGRADIVFGVRGGEVRPWLSEVASNLFWFVYRKFVIKDMPQGGVDIFGCTRECGTTCCAYRASTPI
jgi:glycosyltransferase involved in cell wall biosynthesis